MIKPDLKKFACLWLSSTPLLQKQKETVIEMDSMDGCHHNVPGYHQLKESCSVGKSSALVYRCTGYQGSRNLKLGLMIFFLNSKTNEH